MSCLFLVCCLPCLLRQCTSFFLSCAQTKIKIHLLIILNEKVSIENFTMSDNQQSSHIVRVIMLDMVSDFPWKRNPKQHTNSWPWFYTWKMQRTFFSQISDLGGETIMLFRSQHFLGKTYDFYRQHPGCIKNAVMESNSQAKKAMQSAWHLHLELSYLFRPSEFVSRQNNF